MVGFIAASLSKDILAKFAIQVTKNNNDLYKCAIIKTDRKTDTTVSIKGRKNYSYNCRQ